MAVSKYDKEFLTQREQETVASLTKAYEQGRLGLDAAHGAAEAIRAKHGYSGGDDGSKYVAVAGDSDGAQAVYDKLVRSGKSDGGGYRSQSYGEWKQGEEYRALQELYRKSADTAMQDVVGQLSARTGGLASSYAATAAAQQYNDVMAQLETLARRMYEGDRAAAMDDYQLRGAAEDKAYSRAVYEREYNDARELARRKEEESSKADARERVGAYLAAGGKAAALDRSLLTASGYGDAEIAAFEKYYAQQAASKKASGTPGKADTRTIYEKMRDAGITSDGDVAAYLIDAGYSKAEREELAKYYKTYFGEGEETAAAADGDGGKAEEAAASSAKPVSEEYGTAFSKARGMANAMRERGATDDEILDYLDIFSEEEVTKKGLNAIMSRLGIFGYRG